MHIEEMALSGVKILTPARAFGPPEGFPESRSQKAFRGAFRERGPHTPQRDRRITSPETKALTETGAGIIHKSSDYYARGCDYGVLRADPEVRIGTRGDCGLDDPEFVLSAKDAAGPFLKNFESPFTYEG